MIDKVKEIIAEELGIEVSSIKPDSKIMEDLEADSLSIMQIVMALEEEFDIKIPEDKILEIKTVQEIVEAIKENKK